MKTSNCRIRKIGAAIAIFFMAGAGLAADQPIEEMLLAAIRNSDLPAIDSLAASVNLNDQTGDDPLESPQTLAVYLGNLDIIKLLLTHGMDVNWRFVECKDGSPGFSLAEFALRQGHREIAKYFLSKGACPYDFLMFAIDNKDDELFFYGLAFPQELNTPIPGSSRTLLIAACIASRPDFVAALIKKGADVNVCTMKPDWGEEESIDPASEEYWQNDALAAAISVGNEEILRILQKAGAKPSFPTLNAALDMKQLTLAADMLKQGVKPRASSLITACRHGEAEFVSRFLAMGVSPDSIYAGQTALSLAVGGRNLDIVKILMKAGADPEKPDSSRMTAIDYAKNIDDSALRDKMLALLRREIQGGK